jgi:iron complex transport system ATP-binding protein
MIGYRGTVRLGGRAVLTDVDVTLQAGALAAICGPNGAGKTTLLRAMAGLLPGGAPQPLRVAYVPQGARAAWGMTVREVVALGRIPHGGRDGGAVDRALRLCGLEGLQAARVDRISGGQARRVMLARALAGEPEVLLLDEPTADLDPAAGHAVMALLRREAEAGRTVGVVLHALELAQHHAHRMLLVADGRIAGDGTPAAVMPIAAAAFGLPYGLDPHPRLLPPP